VALTASTFRASAEQVGPDTQMVGNGLSFGGIGVVKRPEDRSRVRMDHGIILYSGIGLIGPNELVK
jgi:hypothetical protein